MHKISCIHFFILTFSNKVSSFYLFYLEQISCILAIFKAQDRCTFKILFSYTHYTSTFTSTTVFSLFPAYFDEDPHAFKVFTMPLIKGLQELQTVAGGAHINLDNTKQIFSVFKSHITHVGLNRPWVCSSTFLYILWWSGKCHFTIAVLPLNEAMGSFLLYKIKGRGCHLDWATLGWRVLVGVLAWVKVSGGQLITGGGFQLELLSIRSSQVVSLWVKVESPSDGQGSDNLTTFFKTLKYTSMRLHRQQNEWKIEIISQNSKNLLKKSTILQ